MSQSKILENTAWEMECLPEYSATVPTEATIGKRWKRQEGRNWFIGEYIQVDDPGKVGIKWYEPKIVPDAPGPKTMEELGAVAESINQERLKEQDDWEAQAAKCKKQKDMYGWNFFMGMAAGGNWIDIIYRKIFREIEKTKIDEKSMDLQKATREYIEAYNHWMAVDTEGVEEENRRIRVADEKMDVVCGLIGIPRFQFGEK